MEFSELKSKRLSKLKHNWIQVKDRVNHWYLLKDVPAQWGCSRRESESALGLPSRSRSELLPHNMTTNREVDLERFIGEI